jgi:RES domain-containing protein
MFLWRISNHADLDGAGGLVASARWHTKGHRVVYLAESPAASLIEVLVHLEIDPNDPPRSYKLLKLDVPDSVTIAAVAQDALPADWARNSLATQSIGDEWLEAGATPLLSFPSAIVPETRNLLLNPRHPDAAKIQVVWHRGFPWDGRLL